MIERWTPLNRLGSSEFDNPSKDKLSADAIAPDTTYYLRLIRDHSPLSFKAAEYVVHVLDIAPSKKIRVPYLSPEYEVVTFAPVCLDTGKILNETEERGLTPKGDVRAELPIPLQFLQFKEGYFVAEGYDPSDYFNISPPPQDSLNPDPEDHFAPVSGVSGMQ